jgi:hypothetical protein
MRISFSFSVVLIFSMVILTWCFTKHSDIEQQEEALSTSWSTITGADENIANIPVIPSDTDTPSDTWEEKDPQQEGTDPLEDLSDSDFDHKSLKDPEMDGLMNYIDSLLAE